MSRRALRCPQTWRKCDRANHRSSRRGAEEPPGLASSLGSLLNPVLVREHPIRCGGDNRVVSIVHFGQRAAGGAGQNAPRVIPRAPSGALRTWNYSPFVSILTPPTR